MIIIGTKKAAICPMLIAYIVLSRIILPSNIFFLRVIILQNRTKNCPRFIFRDFFYILH